jgi:hypothetical protein
MRGWIAYLDGGVEAVHVLSGVVRDNNNEGVNVGQNLHRHK